MTKTKSFHSKRVLCALMVVMLAFSVIFFDPITAKAASAMNPGSNYLGHFTFTGYNGGAYRTAKGTQMRICIAHKFGDSNHYAYGMYIKCVEYGGRIVSDYYIWSGGTNAQDSSGYFFNVSNYFSVKKNVDYRIIYEAIEVGTGAPRKLDLHVWVDII